MNQPYEDTYFLDRDLAYQTALAHNIIIRCNGEKAVQVCYYDGAPFENAPENLVNVPTSEFTRYFSTNTHRLPAKVEASYQKPSSDEEKSLEKKLKSLLQAVKQNLTPQVKQTAIEFASDTLFLDPEMALNTAKKTRPVKCGNSRYYGTQICYYSGDTVENAPDNLINVAFDDLLDFFSNTRLRLPTAIAFHKDVEYEEKDKLTQAFSELLSKSIQNRNEIGTILLTKCQQTKPDFQLKEPLRVLLTSSQYDDLKRPIIEGFYQAFEHYHCKTMLIIEQNKLEKLDSPWVFKEHFNFNPHITLTIDSFDTTWLHPTVFNIFLWWKPPYDISIGAPLSWRNRDIVLPSNNHDQLLLSQSGAKHILSDLIKLDPNNTETLNIDYKKAVSTIINTIQQEAHIK
ncbi:MAG: hypothetical protein GXP08_11665 [Gammaproteobacteria bacterium]|nr:hypothetical protein [Gammaproteobacteria bacterium]